MDNDNIALTQEEARVMTTMVGLSGAAVLLSDNLAVLPQERIDMMKKVMPVLTPSAQPADCSSPAQIDEKWRVPVAPQSGRHLLGLFNWTQQPKDFAVAPSDFANIAQSSLIWEFWTEQFLGRFEQSQCVPNVPAHAVRLLASCHDTGHPQFLFTNHHISQGAFSVTEETWDKDTCCLTVSLHDKAFSGDVIVAIYVGFDYNLSSVNVVSRDYWMEGPLLKIINHGLTEFNLQVEFTRAG